MNSELFVKVSQREERMDRIKAFLIFPVATFHLAIMSGSVRACLKSFDKNGGVGDNRKKQAGAGENASIPK